MTIKQTLILFLIAILISSSSFAQQKNIAIGKPVIANSENKGFPASNAVDGKITRNSKWMSGDVVPPHILEIDLQRYCDISKIVVHTGIPESESTPYEASQAAGFWSAKNFKLQYWDDANWTDIAGAEVHENRLTEVPFTFSPSLNTFKVRFVCDDGEPISIMEIEVFGTETNREAVGGVSDLKKKTVRIDDQDLTIRVVSNEVGKTMKYVAYNQGYYMPGSNVSGWIEYSGVNSLRIWTSLNSFAPLKAVQNDPEVSTITEFDKRKEQLRSNPEDNTFIKWNQLTPLYGRADKRSTNPMVLSYVLSELKRLGVDAVMQINSTDFDGTWSNNWQQWQRYYAIAYYAAREGDVTMFAMQNEPNHVLSGPMSLKHWIESMRIVSDALKSAIEDVNQKYGKSLKARMLGPVTSGNNPDWWAEIARNLRIDYHGNPINEDLLSIFSTHSYNSPASGYIDRVNNIRNIIMDNHPEGKALPIVYTEIGRWMNAYLIDKEETIDSPSLFTEWAGIYTSNTKNSAYGIWAFKLANTTSPVYSSGVKSGHHFTWQGMRIVEDAYTNLAKNKKVITSNESPLENAKLVVDGNKTNESAWFSDSTESQKWIEIDLGEEKTLGSAVVYTGSAGGVYTAPDRVKKFSLQYFNDNIWINIPEFTENNNKYAQVFKVFKNPVTTSKIRFVSDEPGSIKVREIKLFALDDGPDKNKMNYDISGIQRGGHVVRLFAKGFKDERPMLETTASLVDENLDAITSFDEETGRYYIWLVQRGGYTNNLTIDLSELNIASGAPITAESVSDDYFGEVSHLIELSDKKQFNFKLPSQSVVLLTIPSQKTKKYIVSASQDATVVGGKSMKKNFGKKKTLEVQLDASKPSNNKVSYIYFDVARKQLKDAHKILLNLNGYVNNGDKPFRLHVYGIPSNEWKENEINWRNALCLDSEEALIKEVGVNSHIAGEIGFTLNSESRMLDVTKIINEYADKGITFVLVRETRQLGDDEDKGRKLIINSKESKKGPELHFWVTK